MAVKSGFISANPVTFPPGRARLSTLDGEAAVFDEQLVSRFHLLGEPDPTVVCTPPMFIAFDVLQVGAHDVRSLSLRKRRAILEDAIDGSEMALPVRRLEPDGGRAWKTVQRRGLEGFVAKDPESTYRSGPTGSWVKVKLRHEGVFVVSGIRNVDAFDGVFFGDYVGADLRYRGVVEWGFKAEDVLALMRHANDFRQTSSPFSDLRTARNAVWVEPRLRAELSFSDMAGGWLRAPSWRGLVKDLL